MPSTDGFPGTSSHDFSVNAGPASLASVLRDLRKSGIDNGRRLARHTRIRVLRMMTCDDLRPFLQWSLARAEISADISFGDFGIIMPELISYRQGAPFDAIVLALSLEDIAPELLTGEADFDLAVSRLDEILTAARAVDGAVVIANSLVPVVKPARSFPATLEPRSAERLTRRLNERLLDHAWHAPGRFFVVDFGGILERIGREAAINLNLYYNAASPFTHRFTAAWAWDVARLLKSCLGLARKCLVLDCDGVLWGGIVGEEGPQGICLGPDTAAGRIYADFHRAVLDLKHQGVIVALCSKNEQDDVFKILDHHPHCLIKRDDIAAHRINWNDKASNLQSLAAELNLALDSFVFVDDGRFECELVKSILPEVTVRMVPEMLSELPLLLSAEGLFDRPAISAEDRERTALYRAEAERNRAAAAFDNIDDYLRSLAIWACIRTVHSPDAARVSQLTQKTNQFNLTTQRHTVAEIEGYLTDPGKRAYLLEAGDRYGKLGIVGVALYSLCEPAIQLDNILMSCRALGRRLERLFLARTLALARESWLRNKVMASYRPTSKNRQVATFLDEHGFNCVATTDAGEKHYVSEREAVEDWSFIRLEVAT